jgi:hypothetical protein
MNNCRGVAMSDELALATQRRARLTWVSPQVVIFDLAGGRAAAILGPAAGLAVS